MNLPIIKLVATYLTFVGLSLAYISTGYAQNYTSNDTILLKKAFSQYKNPEAPKREVMRLVKSEKGIRNPLIYPAAGLMFLYQRVLSEQISANCMYHTSCSEYTKKNIEHHGLFKGSLIGLHQLSLCVTVIRNQYCKYRINENGKIINQIE